MLVDDTSRPPRLDADDSLIRTDCQSVCEFGTDRQSAVQRPCYRDARASRASHGLRLYRSPDVGWLALSATNRSAAVSSMAKLLLPPAGTSSCFWYEM